LDVFVFPQLAGLGRSETARRYAIASRAEARAYFEHPLLGARLREGVKAVCALEGRSAHVIFGSPDDLKFRSSMTLFAEVAGEDGIFAAALRKYFDGRPDERTLEGLRASG
jgi:uncharacterized protein (DUF1810 family)